MLRPFAWALKEKYVFGKSHKNPAPVQIPYDSSGVTASTHYNAELVTDLQARHDILVTLKAHSWPKQFDLARLKSSYQ